ncbi:MAG TPA: acyl carrier protein [Candidatus Binatia bacterium]|jgi:acyl carrier protein|nr:acyl carrier protein [Candidatus Binatia bacterium]
MTDKAENQQIEPAIREFIATRLLYSSDGFSYADDAPLLREGIIDSLGVVELVEFVQGQFGVKVEQQEVRPDNFDSVSKLAAFVRRKKGI